MTSDGYVNIGLKHNTHKRLKAFKHRRECDSLDEAVSKLIDEVKK